MICLRKSDYYSAPQGLFKLDGQILHSSICVTQYPEAESLPRQLSSFLDKASDLFSLDSLAVWFQSSIINRRERRFQVDSDLFFFLTPNTVLRMCSVCEVNIEISSFFSVCHLFQMCATLSSLLYIPVIYSVSFSSERSNTAAYSLSSDRKWS